LKTSIPKSEYYTGFRDQVGRMEQQATQMKAQEEQMARLDNLIPLGSEAPDFAQPAPDGKIISLSSLRGKVVLIDFWASWCKPCRMENPNVKRVYDQYKGKGFEIIGVSLDDEKDRGKFIELVAKERVTWPQRFQGRGWKDDLARTYTISGIPAMFLLDAEGRLVTTNARGPRLEQEVKRLLKL